MAQWHVHAHSGQRYGPIEREELDRWVNEGRLTARCQVWMDGWPEWRMAPEIFPQINAQASQAAAGAAQQQASQQMGTAAGSPYAAPQTPSHMTPGAYTNPGSHLLPDRGATILVLGLLGLLLCAFLGIPAWIMGSSDLKEIDAGRRDPTGRGMTQAGMILGIIACVLMIVIIGIYAVIFCGALAAGGF
ncbi:MAG: DUF4190 domain-containing protein [Pirellulales bacterium]|nr:DUF4190 domain-containing protein [Pirellulales bacterium]